MADLGTMTATLGVTAKGIAQTQRAIIGMLQTIDKKVAVTQTKLDQLSMKSRVRQPPAIIPVVDMNPAKKSVDEFTSSIFRSAQRWRTVGYLFSITVTAPMVLAGRAALNTAKDFEYAMDKVVGLVGMSRDSMEGFKQQILELAPAVAQTPQKLAEAFYFITSAGFKDGAKAMEILTTSAKLATAGMGETADIAKLLVFSMNAYKKSGLTAARASDVFTAAVREGAIEADGFTSAMQSVLPIASAMGLGIEQVAGSMAAMSLQGATAANSAVYLKGMLNSLLKIKPGSQAAKSLAEFGVTADQLYADLKKPGGLLNVLVQLQTLSNKRGGNIFMKEIFRDIRGMTGALSLTGENLLYNEQVMKAVAAAYGDAGRAFNAVSKDIQTRMGRLKATMDVIKNSFGKAFADAILPTLENLVNSLKKVVDWFNNLSDSSKKTIIHVLGFIAAIGPLALLGSVLKYAYGGLFLFLGKGFSFLRNIVKGLTGDLVAMGNATKINAGLTTLFKKLATFNLAKGGLLRGLGGMTGLGIGALATGLTIATVKIAKYAKEAKKAYQENDLFNKTMLAVNDTMVKFNQIASSDIEAMSLQQLITNREKARQVWEAAYKQYQTFQTLQGGLFQANWADSKLAKEQLDHLNTAKKMYEDLGKAIEQTEAKWTLEKLQQEAAARQVVTDKIKAQNEELQDAWDAMLANMKGVDEMAKVNVKLGKSYDTTEEKVKILGSALEEFTGEKFKLSFDSSEVQTVLKMLKELGYDFTEVGQAAQKFAKDLNGELASINMKESLNLGPEFNASVARLEAYRKAVEDYIEILTTPIKSTGEILDPTADQKKELDRLIKQREYYNQLVEQQNDAEQIHILNMEAEAFGGLAGKIEVFNYELQAAEKKMKELFRKGVGVSDPRIQGLLKDIMKYKEALIDLQNQGELQYLVDIYSATDAFGQAEAGANLLSGAISALQSKLKFLSETGQGSSQTFKDLTKQMRELETAQKAVDVLANAFTDLFQGILDGGKTLEDILKGILKTILNDIAAVIARMIAMKIVMAFLTGGKSLAGGGWNGPGNYGQHVMSLAQGGVVPPGYPNDSYAARLTSGETIIPLKKLDQYGLGKQTVELDADLRFEIEGNTLVAILKKQGIKNSIY